MSNRDIWLFGLIVTGIIVVWVYLYTQGVLDEKLPEPIKKEKISQKVEKIKKVVPLVNKDNKKDNKEEKDMEYIKTDSGLEYRVIKMGNGPKPKPTDTVVVHYEGRLEDGRVFDSSYARGEKISFSLNQVIPGWTEGLQLMPAGSEFEFKIPPELAYGDQDLPGIPAGSTLIFKVELFNIK